MTLGGGRGRAGAGGRGGEGTRRGEEDKAIVYNIWEGAVGGKGGGGSKIRLYSKTVWAGGGRRGDRAIIYSSSGEERKTGTGGSGR